MELAFAITNHKPIILLSKKGTFVPRMARGVVGTVFTHQEYENEADALRIIDAFVDSVD
jgi:hypothetical protein